MSSYKDLRVYILANQVDKSIFELTRHFPKPELYSLTNQILRSAHSISVNIAEGYGRRRYVLDYVRFLVITQGSCDETREHLKTAYFRSYINKVDYQDLDDKLDHIGRMLTLLIRKLSSNETTSKRVTS